MRNLVFFALAAATLLVVLKVVGDVTAPAHDLEQRHAQFETISGRDAVSLGSSVGHAIRFDPMCIDGQEYTASGQDFFEIAAFADAMLALPQPPKLWFIGIAPPGQLQDNGSRAEYKTDWRRRQAYRLLWAQQNPSLIDNDWRGVVTTFISPPLGWNEWQPRIRRAMDIMQKREPHKITQFQPWTDTGTITAEEDRRSALAWADNQSGRINAVRYYDADLAERSQAALTQTNSNIRAQGGTMIIVVPPMTEALSRQAMRVFEQDIGEFRQMLRQLESEGAIVLWHWDNPEYHRNLGLFRDNRHLNMAGTTMFSEQIGRELVEMGVVTGQNCEAN